MPGVDQRQAEHFEQVFRAAARAGFAPRAVTPEATRPVLERDAEVVAPHWIDRVRYQDLSLNRDESQNVTVVTPLSNEMLTSAPDYERLSEQSVTVGENTSVIEKDEQRLPSDSGVY